MSYPIRKLKGKRVVTIPPSAPVPEGYDLYYDHYESQRTGMLIYKPVPAFKYSAFGSKPENARQ